MNNKYLLMLLLLLLGINLKAETIQEYYASAEGKTGNALKEALHNKISVHTVLSYSQVWEALKVTDEDPNNSKNVILLYTGWSYPKTNNGGGTTEWNREHTWAKSKGDFGTSNGPGTDIHHLRPTDVSVNSKRGNLYFDNGGTTYTDPTPYGGINGATGCKYDGDSWEPRDEVKGDVARMLFYMAVRYEPGDMVDLELAEYSSSSGLHGKLSTLLQWHIDDPVDQWEINRNEKIYLEQGNRNPFINHPEYVAKIWGDDNNGGGGTDTWVNIFEEDFETVTADQEVSITGWTVVNQTGSNVWSGKNYNSNKYAQMSGYQGSSSEIDWLITDAIDLSGKSDIVLNFDSKDGYNKGDVVEVLISENYNGDESNATWIKLDATLATGASSGYASHFTNSGNISLSAFSGTVNIAFKYTGGTSSGLTTTMQIDNFVVKGKEITSSVKNEAFKNLNIYPNPATNQLFVKADDMSQIKELNIYNQLGQIIKKVEHYVPNSPIDLNSISKGVYLIQVINQQDETSTQKLLKK